jgi:hypothetical protein
VWKVVTPTSPTKTRVRVLPRSRKRGHLIAMVNLMETEVVGWLADREEAMRTWAKTQPHRRRRTGTVVIVGAMMTVAYIAALVFELVERIMELRQKHDISRACG